jgi:hypothetical protein
MTQMGKFCCLALVVGLLFPVYNVAAQTISIAIVPAAQNAPVDATVEVALVISGLGDFVPPSLGTFDVDVTFDPDILAFQNAVFGDQLDLSGLGSITEVQPGVMNVNLFELSLDNPADLDSLQPGSFTLVTLTFKTLTAGASPLAMLINSLGDAIGNPLAAEAGSGSVTVVTPIVVNAELSGHVKPGTSVTDPMPVLPEAPAGTFSFTAEFCNIGNKQLTSLKSVTTVLTKGNVLINRDSETSPGVGSERTFEANRGYEDLILEEGECVDVPYVIGLAQPKRFRFLLDVLGIVSLGPET